MTRQNASPSPPATAQAATQTIFLSAVDFDQDATDQARAALARGEMPAVLLQTSPETRRQIATGEQQLYSLRLLDFADEDGDGVSISIKGVYFGDLLLANAGARLTIPLRPGERSEISVRAAQDGGGGVTFRVVSSRGELRTRVMKVGEIENWSVAFQ